MATFSALKLFFEEGQSVVDLSIVISDVVLCGETGSGRTRRRDGAACVVNVASKPGATLELDVRLGSTTNSSVVSCLEAMLTTRGPVRTLQTSSAFETSSTGQHTDQLSLVGGAGTVTSDR